MASPVEKKLPRAAVLVILAVCASLPVIEGTQPGDKPTDMTRSVKLKVRDEIIEETVHVDTARHTETFRTASSTGTSFVITDMEKGLTAYRFDDDGTCYILNDDLQQAEDEEELYGDLKQMEQGEVDPAEESNTEDFLTVDEARGQVDPSELSDSMAEFCEGLQAFWAARSSIEPTPTPAAVAEAEEARELMELENLRELLGMNGGTAVEDREKRGGALAVGAGIAAAGAAGVGAGIAAGVGSVVATKLACHIATHKVCNRKPSRVCGRRKRALLNKRGWLGNIIHGVAHKVVNAGKKVFSFGCRIVYKFACNPISKKVCHVVG